MCNRTDNWPPEQQLSMLATTLPELPYKDMKKIICGCMGPAILCLPLYNSHPQPGAPEHLDALLMTFGAHHASKKVPMGTNAHNAPFSIQALFYELEQIMFLSIHYNIVFGNPSVVILLKLAVKLNLSVCFEIFRNAEVIWEFAHSCCSGTLLIKVINLLFFFGPILVLSNAQLYCENLAS